MCRLRLAKRVTRRINLVSGLVLEQVSGCLPANEIRRVLTGLCAGMQKAMEDTLLRQKSLPEAFSLLWVTAAPLRDWRAKPEQHD
jgi:hypothetical protein